MRKPKPGEEIFECPQCGKRYYVRGGYQWECQKYRFGGNGHMYVAGGCGNFGGFKRVGGRSSLEHEQFRLRRARRSMTMRRIWNQGAK